MRSAWLSSILLLPLAYCNPCPDGYSQGKTGGDCFRCLSFYDSFGTQYIPESFDIAESECNKRGGGLLASIHSAEESDTIQTFAGMSCSGLEWINLGLKCTGKDCKWDDGTPVDYTKFQGDGPKDDGKNRCFGIDRYEKPWDEWQERGCGYQIMDCWACRVKAQTIDCVDGETEHRGGCVSVHSTPLDQKTAESSCPGGGHLISIHSTGGNDENEFYKKLALTAGIDGTIYIGGQFSNGVFEWSDGTFYNVGHWANSFPNTIFGTCVQMLLASEFGVAGQWTNIDCSVKQPYMCFRDGAEYGPSAAPVHPKADAKCPPLQYYTGSGTIFSPNYPLSIPSQQTCEYVIGTKEGTKARVKFPSYDCQSGTSLSLFDGLNSVQPFLTFTANSPSPTQYYAATINVMKIVFSANGTSSPIGTGWEAEFDGIL